METINDLQFDIDKYLIEMVKLGDNRAFEVLYQKYWSSLYYKALHQTQSKEVAEELTQELFLNLWDKKSNLKVEKSFQVYIHTSLKYKIINYIKSQIIQRKYQEKVKVKDSFDVVEEEVKFKELYQAFEKELNKLPKKYQKVFMLRKREGMSFKEISSTLDIPLSTVEKHMSKATKLLRNGLEEYRLA